MIAEPTRICVTRHGETDWNIAGILQGWLEVPLNDRGRQQAFDLARAFAGAGFTRVRNLAGGIRRWSEEVDPTVPRY